MRQEAGLFFASPRELFGPEGAFLEKGGIEECVKVSEDIGQMEQRARENGFELKKIIGSYYLLRRPGQPVGEIMINFNLDNSDKHVWIPVNELQKFEEIFGLWPGREGSVG